MERREFVTPQLEIDCSRATELISSKASTEKEVSLSRWCIASLYIYHFSSVIDFSSKVPFSQSFDIQGIWDLNTLEFFSQLAGLRLNQSV